jgi:GAF domain-containing protein
LGPFCGKPACTEIKLGRGVCGTAFAEGRSLLVPDVQEFPGHIACDSASRSELVVPVSLGGERIGVFDLDSPVVDRFREEDRLQVAEWVKLLSDRLDPALAARRPWA